MNYAIGAVGIIGSFYTGGATLGAGLGALGEAVAGPDIGQIAGAVGGLPQAQQAVPQDPFGLGGKLGSLFGKGGGGISPGAVGSNVITGGLFGGGR